MAVHEYVGQVAHVPERNLEGGGVAHPELAQRKVLAKSNRAGRTGNPIPGTVQGQQPFMLGGHDRKGELGSLADGHAQRVVLLHIHHEVPVVFRGGVAVDPPDLARRGIQHTHQSLPGLHHDDRRGRRTGEVPDPEEVLFVRFAVHEGPSGRRNAVRHNVFLPEGDVQRHVRNKRAEPLREGGEFHRIIGQRGRLLGHRPPHRDALFRQIEDPSEDCAGHDPAVRPEHENAVILPRLGSQPAIDRENAVQKPLGLDKIVGIAFRNIRNLLCS